MYPNVTSCLGTSRVHTPRPDRQISRMQRADSDLLVADSSLLPLAVADLESDLPRMPPLLQLSERTQGISSWKCLSLKCDPNCFDKCILSCPKEFVLEQALNLASARVELITCQRISNSCPAHVLPQRRRWATASASTRTCLLSVFFSTWCYQVGSNHVCFCMFLHFVCFTSG